MLQEKYLLCSVCFILTYFMIELIMKKIFLPLVVLFVSTVLLSCKKDAKEDPAPYTPPAAETGQFRLEFEHLVGSSALQLNTANTQYSNNVSETFNVTTFKYYISKVVLKKSDNSEYVIPQSYFLIDASSEEASLITLQNIPVGNYKGMRFTLGVDSTRNVSGAQTGALDPAKGMFWSWNNGYIFLKLEGTSPQSSGTSNGIAYHIGGFRNANNTNALQTVESSFGSDLLRITSNGNPQLHMAVDVKEIFKTPTDISFATTPTVHMPGATAKNIANNYADMFTFEHIHN